MKAAVHLGQDYHENPRTTKNTDFDQVKALFGISQSFILNHKSEKNGISTIEWKTTPWMRSILVHDRAIKLSNLQVHLFSDSVLCLGKIHEHPTSTQKWKDQIGWLMDFKDYQELNGIDGEPVEFEWNIFPGHNTGPAP